MDTLHNWRARRAGGRITITHATGKVVGVDSIVVEGGAVIATVAAGKASNSPPGRKYELAIPAAESEKYGAAGAAMLRTDKPE